MSPYIYLDQFILDSQSTGRSCRGELFIQNGGENMVDLITWTRTVHLMDLHVSDLHAGLAARHQRGNPPWFDRQQKTCRMPGSESNINHSNMMFVLSVYITDMRFFYVGFWLSVYITDMKCFYHYKSIIWETAGVILQNEKYTKPCLSTFYCILLVTALWISIKGVI